MVDDLTDPMSAAMARTHFSEQVENAMRRNGDSESANLPICTRWRAEDDPGKPALERMNKRWNLRKRLLDGIIELLAPCKGGNFNIHIWAWFGYYFC